MVRIRLSYISHSNGGEYDLIIILRGVETFVFSDIFTRDLTRVNLSLRVFIYIQYFYIEYYLRHIHFYESSSIILRFYVYELSAI
mgnify:CR=1 FL=1